jgi:KUP system potassium uptake protein
VSAHAPSASRFALTLGALGIVFGDIGTSPFYTLKECLHATPGHHADLTDVYGIVSLIFWAITLVVTLKYLTFIMKAHNQGEGGIFALLALVPEEMRTARPGRISLIALFAIAGAALLFGDGVITPAISVLSAVEGLALANPEWAGLAVPVSCGILLALFLVQSRGTESIGFLFGPVMLVWFLTLGGLGAYHVAQQPKIFGALSPHHAVYYFQHHGWPAFHILASVVLAVTGGEALYADMGHFGIGPIRNAWLFVVCPSLVLGYLGQAAHILGDPSAIRNPFFSLVPPGNATIALVILSSLAAVIASQALISGAFSLTRQAMQLGYFPRVRVLHTAHDMMGQIYVPTINILTGAGAILLVLVFRESTKLAAAYGIAVAGTMAITSGMYYLVARQTWGWGQAKALGILLFFLSFDIPFVAANASKFWDGGYIPILLGVLLLVIMITWNRGRTLIAQRYRLRFPSREDAMECVNANLAARVPGTAVFMSSNLDVVPPALVRHVERSRALQETVVLLTVVTAGQPTVSDEERFTVAPPQDGFHRIVIRFGFMEEPLVMPALERAVAVAGIPFDPAHTTFYLGRENFLATGRGRMGASGSFLERVRDEAPLAPVVLRGVFVAGEDANEAAAEVGGEAGELGEVVEVDLAGGNVGMVHIGGEIAVAGEDEVGEVVLFEQVTQARAGAGVVIERRNMGALGGKHDATEAKFGGFGDKLLGGEEGLSPGAGVRNGMEKKSAHDNSSIIEEECSMI